MTTRRGERSGPTVAALIVLLGMALAVVHVWHGYAHIDSTLSLVVGAGIPFAFALWVVYGGYWTSRQGYPRRYQLYLLLWTIGGTIGIMGLGGLLIVELTLHGVSISHPLSVIASIATMGAVAGLLIGIYGIQSRHKTDLVTSLQNAATALMEAESRHAVADETVTIVHDVLDMAIAGVWLYDEDTSELRPVAATARGNREFDKHPTYREGNSLSWRAFETGESIVARDLRNYPERYNPETQLRSEIILPLEDQGVLNIGSTASDAFSDVDVSVAHILGSTATAALARAEREERLREQQTTLEQQNKQLEQFASVLSHDLRNPLSVATGRLELLERDCDSDHIDPIATAHDRIDQLIDDLLLLAREERNITTTEPVDLEAVARAAWTVVDGDASLSLEVEGREFVADRARLRQLFENLFRNSVEHGGPGSTIRVGRTEDGFFVADDGPGIPESERDRIFEFGYTGQAHGTGIGLAIVSEIAEAHGWSIEVTESDGGGARFDFSGVD